MSDVMGFSLVSMRRGIRVVLSLGNFAFPFFAPVSDSAIRVAAGSSWRRGYDGTPVNVSAVRETSIKDLVRRVASRDRVRLPQNARTALP